MASSNFDNVNFYGDSRVYNKVRGQCGSVVIFNINLMIYWWK